MQTYKFIYLRAVPLMFLMQLACMQAGSSPSCSEGGSRALMKRCARFDLTILLACIFFKLTKKKRKKKKMPEKSKVESRAESTLVEMKSKCLSVIFIAPAMLLLRLRRRRDRRRREIVNFAFSRSLSARCFCSGGTLDTAARSRSIEHVFHNPPQR